MNYPVWDLPFLGSGLVVAIIAVTHVLVSHLAIGGGAFLLAAELWAGRSPDGPRVRAWLHRYATFFLVVTTVYGAVTGVGIWFSIQLANPEATSLLIHQFVFAWATEWVMFLGELTVLYLYYYGWDVNSHRMQSFLAGAYFVISWMSLFIINGILTFMLTPGEWTLQNTDIVAGFFNPTYWPSLILRTVAMLLIAGLAGMLVATRIRDDATLKARLVAFSAKWVIPAAVLAPVLFAWLWASLPECSRTLISENVVGVGGGRLTGITRHLLVAGIAGAVLVFGTAVVAARPRVARTGGVVALFAVALLGVMGAEFAREMARKPFVVRDVLYSNGVWAQPVPGRAPVQADYLAATRWAPEVTPLSPAHGEWVFRLQCASCHTVDGYRGVKALTAAWTPTFGFTFFESMHAQGVMPPFVGSAADRAALASYLLSLNGVEAPATAILEQGQKAGPPPTAAAPPAADAALAQGR